MNSIELIISIIFISIFLCCCLSSISGVGIGYWIYEYIKNILPPIPWVNSKFRPTKPLECPSDKQQQGALCYDKCPSDYKGVGPVCWPECPSGYTDTGTQCQKKSYGRGAGTPMKCSPNEDLDGALCYPKCNSGYNGIGPVCWQECPSGFTDTGADCLKPKPYGRGGGYTSKKRCEHHHKDTGCERCLLLWYPKCKSGFSRAGCNICSPECPDGMTNIGISCQKKSYGRGAGVPVHACDDNLEKDGALCYPKCKDGYNGVGPVCWQKCPEDVNPSVYSGRFKDTGAQCTKIGKDRGAGTVLSTCPTNWQKIGALCYGPCSPPYPKPDGIFCRS